MTESTEPLRCTRCGEKLHRARVVWVEMDTRDGRYTLKRVPAEFSQGFFPFGPGCAKNPNGPKRGKGKQ